MWHRQDATTLLRSLGATEARGLRGSDAAERLGSVGPNEIETGESVRVIGLLAHQLFDFMIVLLLVAAIVSGIVGDFADTVAIVVIVVLNASFGVYQEYRAQNAIAALRRMSAPTALVVRDGARNRIAARGVVPGDIVLLEAGDVVPADLRLVSTTDLGIDESVLTGESVPVAKHARVIDADDCATSDQLNMTFKSTLVTRGHAVGVVVATGRATEIGRIADLLRGGPTVRTPLQQRLRKLGRRIALAVIAICAVIFAAGLLQGEPPMLMFLTALSLAVAAVPEALPAVVTVTLGLGARRLSQQNALVRRLPAVETLGSVTYICADKTGTLTENRMKLGAIFANGKRYSELSSVSPENLSQRIGEVLALCNDVVSDVGNVAGEPTELALFECAAAAGFIKADLEASMPRVAELPFESDRGYMLTVHKNSSGHVALIKGAPERVVANCVDRLDEQGRSPADNRTVLEAANDLATEGFRVLAVACRIDLPSHCIDLPPEINQSWTFLGLVGLIDPPRPEAYAAIEQCKSAGIVPVMITGDHPATANNIARRLKISGDDADSMTGAQLADLSDEELEGCITDKRVYARVGPEQKIRIVRALQKKGHFVAMTGDGVNDAPALKQSSIGVAMGGRGTEVAREAAEMVLLDDNFATIVAAVREGRRIFDDIRKFVKYALTTNSGEIWVLFLAPFVGLPVPLLPLHILWINLITDGLPGLALSAEPAEPDVMRRPPRPPEQSIFAGGMGAHIIWVGFVIGTLTLAVQAWALHRALPHWQTMVFTVLVFSQLFHCLAIRSEKYSILSVGLTSNRPLLLAITVTVLAQLAVIYAPALNRIFGTQPLSAADLAVCVAVSSIVLIVVEADKLVRRRRAEQVRYGNH